MKHIKLFEEHVALPPSKKFNDEVSNTSLIIRIKDAMEEMRIDGQRRDGDVVSDGVDSVSVSFRNLGNWEHDEEAHGGDDEDGDDSWREDDDAMIWAPGEYKKYMALFTKWAKDKPWFDKVKLDIDSSEKNWVEFRVSIKK